MAALSTYLTVAALTTQGAVSYQAGVNASNDRKAEQENQQREIAAQKETELSKRKEMINLQRRQLLGKGDAPKYRLGSTGATGVSYSMGGTETLTGVTLG